MPTTLTILSSVDRLPAWDNKKPHKGIAFGLNLSVALDGTVDPTWLQPNADPTKDMRKILWPWAWSMPQVRVYRFDGAGNRMLDGTGKVLPPIDIKLTGIDSALAAKVADIQAGLIARFADSAKSQDNFQWQTPITGITGGGSTVAGKTSPLSKDLKPWHTLVGKVSTYPYPVPQALNLSYIFYVDFGNDGTEQVFVAPLLAAGTPFPSVATAPQDPVADPVADAKGRVFRAAYTNVPELPVQAYSSLCVINIPAAANFIDPATQWVGNPGGGNHFDEDWLANFEPRLADAFDLSQLLIRFMKDSNQQGLLDTGDNLRTCARMTLAALADMAGPGWIPSPDGTVLIDKLLATAGKTPLSPTERQALDNTALYPTPDDQRTLLKKVCEGRATYAVLEPSPARIPVSQTISEMEAIRALIQEPVILLKLAGLQWTTLFTNAKLNGRLPDVQGMVDAADPTQKLTLAAGQEDQRVRDLRRQLALSNLGRFWQDFITCNASGDKNGLAMIVNGVPAFVSYYFAKRFSLTPPTWPAGLNAPASPLTFSPPVNNVPSDLAAKLLEQVQRYAQDVLRSITPPAPNAPVADDSRQPNETPHAITLQVDQLAAIPAGDKLSDLLNRFSGVAFLMREKGTQPWMCLNLAELLGSQGTLSLDAPALVPWRVSYRNNLRQVCASYDNRPLVADSPLSRADLTSWVSDSTSQFDVLMTLRYSMNAPMPCLTFGRLYEFAVFAIANSGAIPPTLTTHETGPCVLAPAINDVTGATIREVDYLRRVRLGSARITDLTDPNQAIKIPVIPDNVEPRARDLAVFTSSGAADTKTPVMVLAPNTWKGGVPSVDALISRPGTHWDCWHRWMKGSVTDTTRRNVIADFFRTAEKNSDPKVARKDPLTVDDPALAPWFCFELKEVQDDGSLKNVGKPLWISISEAGFGDSLISRRAPANPFTCNYLDPASLKPGVVPPDPIALRPSAGLLQEGSVITATKGKVYQLGIYCAVTPESKVRFVPGIIDDATFPNDRDGKSYHLVSPHFLAIEAVTDELPDESLVWNSLTLPETTRSTAQISANLAIVGPHIRRAELTRQVWRWQGRNTAIHPRFIAQPARFTAAEWQAEIDKRILDWEAIEFGDRPDVDSTIVPMRTSALSPNGSRAFNYSETLRTSKAEFDQRSLHFRFAVTVYNRYEGMTPHGVKNSITGMAAPSPQTGAVRSVWKRLWIPCRRTSDIHAPRLRLILPLTEAGMSNEPPGLLVVFDEPWHESGGLAECLQVRVALTADPNEDPSHLKDYFLEIGPDPIVGHKIEKDLSHSWNPSEGAAKVTFPSSGILGPVGHYFDPTNQAALFTATSFIIPPPQVANNAPGGGDHRWYFAKLQFRRTLINSVQEISAPSDGQSERYTILDSVVGPYSDPVWTQYLPAFSIFEKTSLLSDKINVSFAFGRNQTQLLLTKDKKPHRLQAMPSDNRIFSLYAVLTRRVFDIAGRADQEQFLGLYSQDTGNGSGWTLADPDTVRSSSDSNYRVRIIEVQRAKPWDRKTKLWDEIFGTPMRADVAARIVRISEPIDFLHGSAGACEGN